MSNPERWQTTWAGLDLTPPQGLYEQVCQRYAEPHRAYHTLYHLNECFSHFDRARHIAAHPFEVELALWFHDAIYEPQAADSEEQSAAWAAQALTSAHADLPQIERVSGLILATKHATVEGSPDHAVLLDTDLSILGAPRPRFLEYESQIRHEYSFVPEETFRKVRAAILARFLERPHIYITDYFAALLEGRARSNLRFSLERLST
jgi:predicted metal-dependent HD superfamily phosphohydrolase